jgi:hypothetical protein
MLVHIVVYLTLQSIQQVKSTTIWGLNDGRRN